jgi:hypothetical protein
MRCSASTPVTMMSKRSAMPTISSAAAMRSPDARTAICLCSPWSWSIQAIEPGRARTSP